MNDIIMPRTYQSLIFFYQSPDAPTAAGRHLGDAAGDAGAWPDMGALCDALESVLDSFWVLCGEAVVQPGGTGVYLDFSNPKVHARHPCHHY